MTCARLVLQLELLWERPALHGLEVVAARVLVQLVQKEAVEEVAPGAQPFPTPLCIPILDNSSLSYWYNSNRDSDAILQCSPSTTVTCKHGKVLCRTMYSSLPSLRFSNIIQDICQDTVNLSSLPLRANQLWFGQPRTLPTQVKMTCSASHLRMLQQYDMTPYLYLTVGAHQEHAHVDVHDLVIEPVEALEAGHVPARHLDVARLVICQDLLRIPISKRPCHL